MKFKVGEIAITTRQGAATGRPAGTEVTIIAVGPFGADYLFRGNEVESGDEYIIEYGDGKICSCTEPFLRKRPQPGIPESILRIFEVELKQEKPA